MKETVSGTYRTTHWNEMPYSDAPALSVAERAMTFEGGMSGSGVVRNSVLRFADGSNAMSGHVGVTGRIGDREGGFVVEESGTGSPEKAHVSWRIVPGSGSGGLAGIEGEGSWTWEAGSETTSYTLTYELPLR